jgi:hypothetical protein
MTTTAVTVIPVNVKTSGLAVLNPVRLGRRPQPDAFGATAPESVVLLGSQTHGEQTPHRLVHPCNGASGGRPRLGSSLSGSVIFSRKRSEQDLPFQGILASLLYIFKV